MIRRSRNRLKAGCNSGEVAQLLQPTPRSFDLAGVRQRPFHLNHAATEHAVGGHQVTFEIDPTDVSLQFRCNQIGDVDLLCFRVKFWNLLDLRLGITGITHNVLKRLDVIGQASACKGIARLYRDCLFQSYNGIGQVTGDFHLADLVFRPFLDTQCQVNLAGTGIKLDAWGINLDLGVAVIQIQRAKSLNIPTQLLLVVTIGFCKESPKTALFKLHFIGQVVTLKGGIAKKLNLPDTCNRTLSDLNFDTHPVVRQLDLTTFNTGVIAALIFVLSLQRFGQIIQRRLVNHLTFTQTQPIHHVANGLVWDQVIALDQDTCNGRAFLQFNQQHIPFAGKLN